jgi:hypothetical protein
MRVLMLLAAAAMQAAGALMLPSATYQDRSNRPCHLRSHLATAHRCARNVSQPLQDVHEGKRRVSNTLEGKWVYARGRTYAHGVGGL